MSVFKEEDHVFENIMSKQERIFRHGPGYGYAFDSKNPPKEVQAVFDVINELKKDDHGEIIKRRDEGQNWVEVDVVFLWEEDMGYYMGTKYTVHYEYFGKNPDTVKKGVDAYIQIGAEPYKERI